MWRSALRIPDPFLEFCQNKRGILGNNWELKYFFKDFQYLEIDFLVLRVVCGSSMFFVVDIFFGGRLKAYVSHHSSADSAPTFFGPTERVPSLGLQHDWLVVWNMFYFSIYWE